MMASEESKRIARALLWWQLPVVSLANLRRFLGQVMTLGTWQEAQLIRDAFGWNALKDALLNTQPGVFDGPSWAYWRAVFHLPEAELPRRSFNPISPAGAEGF